MTDAAIKALARYAAGVAMILAGMHGLYLGIPYSGWVLFFGIIIVL